ncbi:MAG: hypothetical protein ACO26G_05960 [Rickettsiales bacterium]
MKNLYLEKILRTRDNSEGSNNSGTNPESAPNTPPPIESSPSTPRDQIVPLRSAQNPVPGAPIIERSVSSPRSK